MIHLGAYQSGQNKLLDCIIQNKPEIDKTLIQLESEHIKPDSIWIIIKKYCL